MLEYSLWEENGCCTLLAEEYEGKTLVGRCCLSEKKYSTRAWMLFCKMLFDSDTSPESILEIYFENDLDELLEKP